MAGYHFLRNNTITLQTVLFLTQTLFIGYAYFHELAQTSQKYFIPYIKQFKQLGQDSRILEIGCGDGGNLLPFAQMGYYTLGVDISERRIADAQKFFTDCNAKGDFLARRHHLP